MKKTIALILVLMMCFTLAAPALASTVAEQYTYTVISDSYVKITKYIGSENEIVIPSEIDGYPVQVIGKNAFYSCKAITSVTIPNTVKTIEASAFAWCEKLTSVSIPDSVTSIGDFAFMSCNGLPTITIPNSVRSMGTSVFRTCKSLTSATISNALTTIANEMFYGCSKLSGVTIPTGVFSIGERAFFNCSALKSVTMPDSVNYIKEQAFYGCRSLTELTLPNDLREIAKDAFTDCESLQNVSIPASVKTMGTHPFRGCKSLENIEVADDNPYYTDIDGVLVNKDKTMLIQYPIGKTNSSYTVPSGITHILGYAFAESTSLTSVTLSETVEDISNDDIFNSCPNLLNFEAAENNSSFCDVDGVLFNKDKTEIIRYPVGRTATSYAVPDGVTHIGDDAFTASRVLVNVTLPDTVTVIGDCSFTGCTSLESLNIPPSVTEIRLLKEIDGMQVLGDPQTFITCDKLTIYGESGSYAEAYANDCEIPFVCIEPTPAPTVAPTTQAPTAAPTTAAPTEAPSKVYTRAYIEYVGNSANTYITNNGKLPANANLGHGATNMAEVLGAFAQYVVDTNNGLTGDVAGNSATIPEMMYEDLTEGTLTKAQYIALAQAIVDYIAENSEAPAYLECDLGALSMNTLVRIFAKVVAERKATKALPETV
ncbi:MAG: leucine-rich repeat domain-containing protein, partial [Clostridia bacterium]|nr:leucine-rich repeat domain-containing protein [Clostridia bacterium]